MNNSEIIAVCLNIKTAVDSMTKVSETNWKALYNAEVFNMVWGLCKAANYAVAVAESLDDANLSDQLQKSIDAMHKAFC